jgi:hypothetical protein
MSTLVLEVEPAALDIQISDEWLTVNLTDGRVLRVPLHWYPRLVQATAAERNHWQLLGDGYAVEWPELDEHIGIEGLLAGRRSGESQMSFEQWLQKRTGL